jgi:pyruvate/2-oxoglutarate/acetoin dehydrogenase E1 component
LTPYRQAVVDAMSMLAEDPWVIFIGQTVRDGGAALGATLSHLPAERRVEMPVFENTQMGMSIGLSLTGWVPVSIYPRVNFLLEAVGQLVQHLDKLPEFGNGYRPKVIIRTAIATPEPLDPGPQHLGDYMPTLRTMLRNTVVVDLKSADLIVPCYRIALAHSGSTILVEHLGMYG